ncbi:MAG: hypothetical protein ACREDD_05185 [Methylocella sp.]
MAQGKLPEKDQYSRFVETARKLGCGEDKERFEKSLGKVVSYKPPKKPSKKSSNHAAAKVK